MMRKVKPCLGIGLVLALVLLAINALASSSGGATAVAATTKHKGMTFIAYRPGAYASPRADRALEELAEDGADWLCVVVTVYQDTRLSTTIYAAPETPTDADLIHVIDKAHRLGMKVFLKPHLDLASDPTHWRGQIGMGFSADDWTAWFASYKGMINRYAQLAQAQDVDLLAVGTELLSTEFRTADWRAVIAGVRALYQGLITYAGSVGPGSSMYWWDEVDLIGIDPYYGLSDKGNPTMDELKAGWVEWVDLLRALAQSTGKPILFTEIGYLAVDGTNVVPWNGTLQGALDVQEQADLYEALFQTFWSEPWFAGVYWWEWEPDPLQGGPCNPSYTPHDKPAEDVLRRWYGAPLKPVVQYPAPDESRMMAVYDDTVGPGWITSSWSGTFDVASTVNVAQGTYAISAVTQAWGALSLHHSAFSTAPYYYLEFYLYKTINQPIRVWMPDGDNAEIPGRPVEDCRYTEGKRIAPGTWARVRIPLQDLGASDRLVQRIIIGNWSNQGATYYVDDLRLVGASGSITATLSPTPGATRSATPTPTRTSTPMATETPTPTRTVSPSPSPSRYPSLPRASLLPLVLKASNER